MKSTKKKVVLNTKAIDKAIKGFRAAKHPLTRAELAKYIDKNGGLGMTLNKSIAQDKQRMATDNEYRVANGFLPKTFDPKRLPNIIPTYTVSLKYGDKVYTQSSDDITEAILALKPDRINNRTVFTLEYNGKKSEVMKSVPRAKRILSNPLAAKLLGKYLIMRAR